MRASIKRVLLLVAFGLCTGLAGAYLGVNQAYDRLDTELPMLIESAGCVFAD